MDELIKELKIENVVKKQPQGYSLDMQDDIEYGKGFMVTTLGVTLFTPPAENFSSIIPWLLVRKKGGKPTL